MNIYGGSIAKAVTSSKQENGEEEEEKRDKAQKLTHVIKVVPSELFKTFEN